MSRKLYSVYTAEEFALDDLFVRWVQHPDDEEVAAYWQSWLAQNPHQQGTVDLARALVQTGSQSALPSLRSDEIASVWSRIRESLQTMEDVRPLQPDVRAVVGWWYFMRTVAAALSLVLLVGWALWMQYGPDQSIRMLTTSTGQTRTVRLPDNSTVVLYANSSIRYARRWSDESPRAVWLRGEADFSVVHRNGGDTTSAHLFRVHTSDLTVEAVGTIFRVRQRPEGTRVALRSGRVNLLVEQQKSIRLRPGDSVEVTAGAVQTLP